MLNDMILMKPTSYNERESRRIEILNDVSFIERIEKEKADDLEAQYKRVFKINGKTVQINISGPLSQDGPDWIDVYLGYGGTAYKNIVRAAGESKELFETDQIENVIVRMNTPGGTVDGVDNAYHALKEIGSIGVVKNDGMIASGGVWLASAFDRIEPATDTAVIGSIGVVARYADYTGYYDSMGIQIIDVTNKKSPNKRPDVTTKEGFNVIQKELDDLYNVFVSRVTAARPITKKDVDSLKGEMLIASRAVSFGLMDEPQNGETPEGVETENKNNETEASQLENTEGKKVLTESAEIIDLVTPAIEAERKRFYGLVKISGLEISEDLKAAIDSGVDVGSFAVAAVEKKEALANAQIEAEKELRANNKDQELSIDRNGDKIAPGKEEEGGEKSTEIKKHDELMDEIFEDKKGGKK